MAAKTRSKRSVKPPWKRDAPERSAHHELTPAKKASAKRSARKAGRPYPNLVDNMRAAKQKGKR